MSGSRRWGSCRGKIGANGRLGVPFPGFGSTLQNIFKITGGYMKTKGIVLLGISLMLALVVTCFAHEGGNTLVGK
jgi:hypothetical protein